MFIIYYLYFYIYYLLGGSVARLACSWTQAQKGLGSNRIRDALGNSLRQTVYTHCASVHQATGSSPLKDCGVTAGLAESNGSLSPGL